MNKTPWKGILLFLFPVAVLYILFFIYPLGFVFAVGFTQWNGVLPPQFIGLQNYSALLQDDTFLLSVRNNFIWAFSLGFLQIPLAALVALILARKPSGWKFFRTLYFLPNVISQVAISMLWLAIYNAEYGVLNKLLELLGYSSWARNWLGEIETALPAIILQQVLYIGYFMIIILAGAMAIPSSYYEAAEMDGASVLQQEWHITLPMLRSILVTCMTLAMAYGLRHFEATFLMTGGGPANSTSVMGIQLYNNMSYLRYGRANAIGTALILLGVLVIVTLRNTLGRSEDVSEALQ
ncbi:MAG TPA: sugar ABC transporter permease [Spirochaetales bacterium]|nr:sugar ABC transporter permease [Spirochaetales bacterium]HOV39134.1 sugar ABC transporter permease [Spirochaetales bacterium]